ncbi:unnamed protein product [Polarella glacialis]|uniref:Protein kinase domain-containing protein n=1 Tax=Polarella glacialis TaxID=89957 RepID=A0A813KSB1_POLGL|nr:unnamed protein product [Polarella glacialis]
MDFLGDYTLHTYLHLRQTGTARNSTMLPFQEVQSIFAHMLKAIAHCHAHHVCHRDIKFKNAMINSDGRVTMVDFGLAVHVAPGQELHDSCGTVPFAAPEVLICSPSKGYDGTAADIWSLAICLIEMLCGLGTVESIVGLTQDDVSNFEHIASQCLLLCTEYVHQLVLSYAGKDVQGVHRDSLTKVMRCVFLENSKTRMTVREIGSLEAFSAQTGPLPKPVSRRHEDSVRADEDARSHSTGHQVDGEADSLALRFEDVKAAVIEEVQNVQVIDVHTHLLPPSHGKLMLWGIDELLTYHYLVSEYFMVGVITTLQKLGLGDLSDLKGIRAWFAAQDLDEHVDRVFRLARVRYAVMTNIPYVEDEAQHWRVATPKPVTPRLRTALRIDSFLKGDWASVSQALKADGLEETLEGAKQYLRKWAQIYKPEYMMASTPHDWRYPEPAAAASMKPLVRAFAGFGASELLEQVVAPVCEELSLPIALKLGAWRGMSPELNPCCGGDGVASADIASLQALCAKFPRVKFLATVLSRANQHEVTVVAQKTRNLHLYGCWWYCNNPSIIEELTKMRVELLGTAFTAQHSDCRVLEQMLYKWEHSREVIGQALGPYYERLVRRGWRLTRGELRRDVQLLLAGSYEAFMAR